MERFGRFAFAVLKPVVFMIGLFVVVGGPLWWLLRAIPERLNKAIEAGIYALILLGFGCVICHEAWTFVVEKWRETKQG